ncbi:ATP-binding cassette sub-family C member 5-like [Babylonia areolata]|uniref:ATP-binding cassette sub-family C member 5-like n=1 Tax=Babylonia areolata TaxID=304850 RepID=UPI003FD17071
MDSANQKAAAVVPDIDKEVSSSAQDSQDMSRSRPSGNSDGGEEPGTSESTQAQQCSLAAMDGTAPIAEKDSLAASDGHRSPASEGNNAYASSGEEMAAGESTFSSDGDTRETTGKEESMHYDRDNDTADVSSDAAKPSASVRLPQGDHDNNNTTYVSSDAAKPSASVRLPQGDHDNNTTDVSSDAAKPSAAVELSRGSGDTCVVSLDKAEARESHASPGELNPVSRDSVACEEVLDMSRSCGVPDSGQTEGGDRTVPGRGDFDEERGRESEGERTELLPNGARGSHMVHSDEEEEEAKMANSAQNMKDRVQSLSASVLDLQARSEIGGEVVFAPYVKKPRPAKYSHTLKSFLPVRPNGPKDILPVSSSGCLNLLTYGWVTPIIMKVYRKGAETLKSYRLSNRDSAETHAARLEHFWKEEVERRGPANASFFRVIFRAFFTKFICSLIFLLLFVFFSLLNPIYLIRSFLEYLSRGEVEVGVGLAYVVGMILCELMRSITMGQTWFINYQAGMRIRAGAVTLLFKKILNLKGLKDKTVGELVNLVGNDSQRIFEAMAVGPLVLAGPVAMTASCIYAWIYLGPWSLVGCGVFVGFYPFNAYVSKLTTYLRRKGILITDKRVRMMSELLSCIKLIKMYAWERPFANKISVIRLQERGVLEKSAMVQSISTGTAIMVPTVASALTFIAIVSSGQNLTAAEAFSFVALLNAMRFALGVLPYGVKSISEVTVSLKRYTSILLMEEMEEKVAGGQPPPDTAVEVKDATLTWSTTDPVVLETAGKDNKSGDDKPSSRLKSSKNHTDEERQKMLKDTAANTVLSDTTQSSVLINISFTLKKGQLLGVCGSVGSGKSSLIQAILGRMDKLSGSICVGGTIAYVPQQAWIMNATARDNILFGTPYNEDRYSKVVEACALQADFASMVSGDLTEIGERGINLSGGQKQRLSMARALYSDRDIYLLDDPLSAVDIHIGRHIFTNCITGFLTGKSVIFVTHQLQYLPQCDDILFLKDGQVTEQGDHSSLMVLKGDYFSIMRIYYQEHTMDTENLAEEDTPEALVEVALSSSGGSSVRNRVVLERALSYTSKTSGVEELGEMAEVADMRGAGDSDDKAKGKLIAEEDAGKGGVDRDVFLSYMRAAGGYCVSLLVFLVFLVSIGCQNSASLFLSFWLGQGSGNTTIQVDNQTRISDSVTDHPLLFTYTLIYGMIIVAIIVFLVLRAVIFMKYTLRASSSMHDDVFEKILRCPMSFFDTTPLGRIVNRFSSDMDEVDVRLPMTFEVFIANILHILFSLGLISFVAPWFLLALLPLVVAFTVIFRVFTGTIRDMKRQDMVTRAPLVSHITASVQGITTIHAYCKADQFLSKFCNMLNKNTVPFVMFFISNRWLALRLDLLCVAITGVTSLIIILTNEHITAAMAGLALSSAIQMTGLFQFTVRLATETEARFTSVQRVVDYSKTIESEAASIVPGKRPKKDWPNSGGMVFRNVQMRYRPNLPLVLKGVSFKVNPQEKIGIVGRTGSGKSSLGVALFRLVELSGGSIRIDDLDVGSMGLEDLRSKLSIIPQDPVLFVGTVRYNLDPLHQHDDHQLWLALEKCHIKESIAGLEQKLEAPVVENGENFSVGERQLLCMARALLRHSKVLMLDEATAAIDTETDALVQATLKEAFWDCTMLIIAHRLNTVLSCDKILVMDDGKVMEFDRPSTLMSKSGSVFRNMLEASEGTLMES